MTVLCCVMCHSFKLDRIRTMLYVICTIYSFPVHKMVSLGSLKLPKFWTVFMECGFTLQSCFSDCTCGLQHIRAVHTSCRTGLCLASGRLSCGQAKLTFSLLSILLISLLFIIIISIKLP